MKITIDITDDYEVTWDGHESEEEIAELLYCVVTDFDKGVNKVRAAQFESIGEILH